MEYTENYNLKKPDMNDTALISDINENMDIIDQKLKEAGQNEQLQSDVTEIKGTTEDIKTSIGSAEDLSSSPTIFGKLAEIKEIITSKFADIISKITGIDSKIGTTTDTGGTSSAGGIFAKLNNVISYLTGYITQKIDTIDSNVTQIKPSTYNAEMNAHQAATNTAINNTPSATGILSQKMSYAINQLSNYNIDDAISFINNLKIDKQMYVNTRETCLFCADEKYLYLIPSGSEEGVICRIKQDTFEVDYKKINIRLSYVDNNTILVDKNYIYFVDSSATLYKINKSTFTVSGSLDLSSTSNLGVPKGFMGQTNSYLVLRGAGSSSYQPYRINKNTLVAESLSALIDSDAQLSLDDVLFDETYMYYFRTINNVCTIYKVNISQKTKSTIYTFNAPRGETMHSLSIDASNLYFQFDNLLYTVSKTGSLIDTFYIGNLKEMYPQNTNIVSYGKNPLAIVYRKSFWSVNYVNYEEKIVKTASWQYPYTTTSSNYRLYLAYPDEFIFGKTNFAYVLSTHNGINKIMKFILD